MKVLYIQYAGDFAEGYERLVVNTGKENYYGQRYSVQTVVQQARENIEVMVLVLMTDGYRIELEKNLTAVGLKGQARNYELILNEIMAFAPDSVILRSPDFKILRFLRKNKIRTFPVFADSFENIPLRRVKTRIGKYLLAKELKHKSIKWIANHQINASKSIQGMGVKANKILPYDWEHLDNPSNWIKNIPSNLCEKKMVIFYAGSICPEKGVFDLVYAAQYLRRSQREFVIKIAGKGELDQLGRLSNELGVSSEIKILGLIDHEDVLINMNEADVVVVPSHHSYPEGLPMTIMESLMVRTPVIASDHPMFVDRVGSRGSVVFFREKDTKHLGKKIISVCSDLEEYRKMVSNTQQEWLDLILTLKWADMINNWIHDTDFDFSDYSLEQISP